MWRGLRVVTAVIHAITTALNIKNVLDEHPERRFIVMNDMDCDTILT